MVKQLLGTTEDWVPALLRIALGGVMFPHGAQKLLGWFGGYGFVGTMDFLTGMGMPTVVAFLVIMGESLGALALMLGFLTRFCAFSLTLIMVGAIGLVHWQNGFFMNWGGQAAGEGFEYHLLMVALGVVLMVRGGGSWSLDGLLTKRR